MKTYIAAIVLAFLTVMVSAQEKPEWKATDRESELHRFTLQYYTPSVIAVAEEEQPKLGKLNVINGALYMVLAVEISNLPTTPEEWRGWKPRYRVIGIKYDKSKK